MIEWLQRHNPDRVFLISGDSQLSYGEVRERVSRTPAGLIEALRPSLHIESVVKLLAVMSAGTVVVFPPHTPDAGIGWVAGASMVVFTSGTTGEPKGVRLTKANWSAAAEASVAHLDHGPDDVWLLAMPLHHVGGLGIILRSAYAGGGVRMLPAFEPAAFAKALRQVTMASVVPTMLSRVLDVDPGPYDGMRAVLVGGGPIPDGLLERASQAGLPVLPTYGMTETCGQVATLLPGSAVAKRAHPLPGVDLRIGVDGQIAVRGPMVSPGYVGDADRDPADYFVTGDTGEIDPDGALIIHGRLDDLIITGGENVSPALVEKAVMGIEGVERAMVVGVPSQEWGMEVGCIYIGAIGPDLVRSRLAGSVPGVMIPRKIKRVEFLPVTGLGKPDRSAARSMLVSEGG